MESNKHKSWSIPNEFWWGLGLFLGVFLVYAPSLNGSFIWDDDLFIHQNPLILSPGGLKEFWFSTKPPDFFPLVSSLIWAQWRLWGQIALGFRITTLILHSVSAVLLWRCLSRLRVPAAGLAAFSWAVHPLTVMTVCWPTETKNTLSGLFFFATIALYLHYVVRRSAVLYAASLCCYMLALLSKTSVVPMPVVLLVLIWLHNKRITKADIRTVVPYALLALVMGLITVWYQYNRSISHYDIRSDSGVSRLVTAGWAVWFYLSKCLWPARLAFVYGSPDWSSVGFGSFIPLTALLSTLWMLWHFSGRYAWARWSCGAALMYGALLLPVLGFLNIFFMRYTLVADHWQYLASSVGISWAVCGAAALLTQFRAPRIACICIGTVVVSTLIALNLVRQPAFSSEEALFRSVTLTTPEASFGWTNLATVLRRNSDRQVAMLSRAGKKDEALQLRDSTSSQTETMLLKAFQLDPKSAEAAHNLAALYYARKDYREANRWATQASQLLPGKADIRFGVGLSAEMLGNFPLARSEYRAAIRLGPFETNAELALANLLLERGTSTDLPQVAKLLGSLKERPDPDPLVFKLLASTAERQGDTTAAVQHLTALVCLAPRYCDGLVDLARLKAEAGDRAGALSAAKTAVETCPTNTTATALLKRLESIEH